jgi:hypothetical protein
VASSSWLPSFSSVVWSAFRAGGCGFVSWRVSSRALSGRVAVASFGEFRVASAFARSWAGQLGRSVAVRPGPVIGGRVRSWRVSVPVLAWAGSFPAGQLLVLGGGGLRGVAASLRALGFVSAVAS